MSTQSVVKPTRSFNAAEMAERSVNRRAVEAVIWGVPAVNVDLMYQAMALNTDGRYNHITGLDRDAI